MGEVLAGFGVGFRPEHYSWVIENLPGVDWFEIISENFMGVGGKPRRFLEKLRADYPIATHGVSLSIASIEPLDFVYLRKLKELLDWIQPSIVSDHLCWTRFGGVNSHDLLPIPYTVQSLKNIISRVNQVQDFLGTEILLENPSAYVEFKQSEISEADFYYRLCKTTGCGILLDVNNLYVNWKNLGRNPREYLDQLPGLAVKQFHLAGHSVHQGVLIDTHDGPVCDEVWELYKKVVTKWPNIPALIEWDDRIPEFERLMSEVDRARQVHREAAKLPSQLDLLLSPPIPFLKEMPLEDENSASNELIFENMLSLIRSRKEITDREPQISLFRSKLPLSPKKGAVVYQQAFHLRIRDVLMDIYPTLAFIAEEEAFSDLVNDYLSCYPPAKSSVKYAGEKFPEYLKTKELPWDLGVPGEALSDIALLEWNRADLYDCGNDSRPLNVGTIRDISPEKWEAVRFRFIEAIRILPLQWDVGPVWKSVVNDAATPSPPEKISCHYLIYRPGEIVLHRKLEKIEAILLEELLNGQSFLQACETLVESGKNESIEMVIPSAVKLLSSWLVDHLITRIYSEPF